MTRSKLIGLAGAALGGAGVATLLLVSLTLLSGGVLGQSAASSAVGWVMPVAAGLTAAGVAWSLTDGRPPRDQEAGADHAVSSCAACGGAVFDEWRLCPHCGALMDEGKERTPGA